MNHLGCVRAATDERPLASVSTNTTRYARMHVGSSFSKNRVVRASRALESSPPKKNWILSAERLRRLRHFLRRMRRAAARHLGGAASSSYFKRRPQVCFRGCRVPNSILGRVHNTKPPRLTRRFCVRKELYELPDYLIFIILYFCTPFGVSNANNSPFFFSMRAEPKGDRCDILCSCMFASALPTTS